MTPSGQRRRLQCHRAAPAAVDLNAALAEQTDSENRENKNEGELQVIPVHTKVILDNDSK